MRQLYEGPQTVRLKILRPSLLILSVLQDMKDMKALTTLPLEHKHRDKFMMQSRYLSLFSEY